MKKFIISLSIIILITIISRFIEYKFPTYGVSTALSLGLFYGYYQRSKYVNELQNAIKKKDIALQKAIDNLNELKQMVVRRNGGTS